MVGDGVVILPSKIIQKRISMKRLLTMTLLLGLLFGACEKEGIKTVSPKQNHNRVITLPSEGKTGNSYTIIVMDIGHSAKDCGGCIMIDGQLVHEDCMGSGNYCIAVSSVQLHQVGSAISATTTDTFGLTSENYFLMPDRSLNYTDENNNNLFLNIPAQLVYRNTSTLQFTFTGLSLTSRPVYNNY